MCTRLATYFWSVDKVLMAAAPQKFLALLWQRYVEELRPRTGVDPKLVLTKLYEYVSQAPEGVFLA